MWTMSSIGYQVCSFSILHFILRLSGPQSVSEFNSRLLYSSYTRVVQDVINVIYTEMFITSIVHHL